MKKRSLPQGTKMSEDRVSVRSLADAMRVDFRQAKNICKGKGFQFQIDLNGDCTISSQDAEALYHEISSKLKEDLDKRVKNLNKVLDSKGLRGN